MLLFLHFYFFKKPFLSLDQRSVIQLAQDVLVGRADDAATLEVQLLDAVCRPKDKNDIFVWRGKGQEHELKTIKRHAAPLQTLSSKESQQVEQPMGQVDKLKEKDNKPKEHE